MDWRATLDTSNVVGPAEEATRALGTMRGALAGAGSALGSLGESDKLFARTTKGADDTAAAYRRAGAAAGSAEAATGKAAAAQKKAADAAFMSTRAAAKKGGWSPEKEAYELAKRTRIAAKGAGANGVELAKLEQKEGQALDRLRAAERKKADYLKAGGLKALGAGAAVVAAGVGAASAAYGALVKLAAASTGVGSFEDLTKIAIGARAMGQIQGIAARTNMSLRGMLRGVDAQPLVRATEMFSRNFSQSTVTGRAVGDMLTRSFNGFFSLLEKIEPVATGAFQGMVLGALKVEIAWLELQLAAAPIVKPILKAVDATDALEVAGTLAAEPFRQLANDLKNIKVAIDLAVAAYNKIKTGGAGDAIDRGTKAAGNAVDSVFGDDVAKAGRGDGPAVGGALGDGIVAGLDAKEGAIYDAGKRATDAAVRGAKDGAEIRSPSRKMRRDVGRQLGEGVALGEEDMRGRVQRAAATSLVPDAPLGGGAPARGGGVSLTGPLVHVGQIVVGTMEDLGVAVRRLLDTEAERAAERLGIALPARA